jgi:hypothetical protein
MPYNQLPQHLVWDDEDVTSERDEYYRTITMTTKMRKYSLSSK